jgi:hypothetical protein
MAIRLVRSAGSVNDPAVMNIRCSGTVWPGSLVDFSRTAGQGVIPASSASTTTMVFGVCQDYREGTSDAEVRIIRIDNNQLWEVDCTDAALTAQIGLRHVMNDAKLVRNTSSDLGAGTANTAVFRAVAMVGSTSGSGKLIGYFRANDASFGQNQTTYI